MKTMTAGEVFEIWEEAQRGNANYIDFLNLMKSHGFVGDGSEVKPERKFPNSELKEWSEKNGYGLNVQDLLICFCKDKEILSEQPKVMMALYYNDSTFSLNYTPVIREVGKQPSGWKRVPGLPEWEKE